MNETKRNEIEKVYEILTREELIELCKKLMSELIAETKRNRIEKVCETLTREETIGLCEKLIDKNEELKAINYILRLVMGVGYSVVRFNESANLGR